MAAIGASAGGPAALESLFAALPDAVGVAFVVIVHGTPGEEGALVEVLSRRTSLPVHALTGERDLEPDRVYVVPPGRGVETGASRIRAIDLDRAASGAAPIDACLESLASTHGDGFALILSGAGGDGAIGLRAIKGAGGLILVQDPDEADFDSMPRAAIATGAVDLVLPVAALGARLAELAASKLRALERIERGSGPALSDEAAAELGRILAHLRARTGHDFSRYKRATVLRRVLRRMQIRRADSLRGYLDRLRADATEPAALLDDLLITVTAFFRDAESWRPLVERVVPALVGERAPDEPVRVWVPGCATGEEAYSIAMLLIEEAERRDRRPELQLFATDLDEGALATARAGRYPATVAADLSPGRLARFFVRDGDAWRVGDALRERVLFTRHNLLKDPPFTRLDLVSCRNLLIYLDRDAQAEAFDVFRYALNPGGYLFLGVAETAGAERFEAVDAAARVYRARPSERAPRLPESMISGDRPEGTGAPSARRGAPAAAGPPEADLHLLSPPGALVDGEANVLRLVDGAGRYLVVPDGAPTVRLDEMVRPELRAGLRAALDRAFGADAPALEPPVSVRFDARVADVALWVRPRPRAPDGVRRALVVFVEQPGTERALDAPEGAPDAPEGAGGALRSAPAEARARRERRLDEELELAEARLRASGEDHRRALDAARSANEELQSVNEEYRSTAEELETSKEELQSINEELNGVNAELERRLEEVSRARDDLENLMAATDIGTLFLDRELRIQRFTPSLGGLFNVRAGDRGRAIGDLTHRLDYAALEADARRVLESLVPFEREVVHEDGRTFVARARPYRTAEHRIDGLVLTFVDVSGLKRARLELDSSERRLEALMQSMPDVAFSAGADGTLTYVGARVLETAGVAPESLVGGALWDELVHPDDRAHAEAAWVEAIGADEPYEMRFRLRSASGDHRWVIARARRVARAAPPGGTVPVVERVGTITDVDELTRAEQALREADRHRNRFLGLLGHELRNPLAALGNSLQVLDTIDPVTLDGVALGGGATLGTTIEALRRQGRHMSRLVDDLLDLTRISTGKIRLEPRRLDLVAAADAALDAVRPRAEAAGLALRARLPEGTLYLDADPERLDQVLGNLLDNAIKYSDPGGRVELVVEPDGNEVRIAVVDAGIGIAAEALPTLFEPFTQGVGPDGVSRDGLGLGLALVRSIAALHGGTIRASSAGPGEGSELVLRLPLAAQRAEARASGAGRQTGHDPEPDPGSERAWRLLVVDDSPDVAEPFATLLRSLGHEVEVALDGPAALASAAAHAPELAFLDLGMPGMNGLELARRLRRDFAPGALRLVAVTGFGQPEDVAAAREVGFDEHLLKPVRLATVRAMLRALDRR